MTTDCQTCGRGPKFHPRESHVYNPPRWGGERFRTLQTALGDTNDAMAERLGVSLRTVESWRQGAREPRKAGIRAVLEHLERRAA